MIQIILLTIVYLFTALSAYLMIMHVIVSYYDKKFLYVLAEQTAALRDGRYDDVAKYGDKLGSLARTLDRLETLLFFI